MTAAQSAFFTPQKLLTLRTNAAVKALLPFIILLVWSCAVRLPFFGLPDEDEFFFSVVAQRWLDGYLPYVASFDIKPPGLFAIFAMVQSVFGASLTTIKGLEIVFTALGAFGLYRLMDRQVSRSAAFWAAGLYPVYSLTLSGFSAANMLVQLPFFIFAFDAALTALRDRQAGKSVLMMVFWSGLSVGVAGMIKQTALFEAIAIFALLCLYTPPRHWLAQTLVFGLGAALPAIGFSLYFLATGHFHDMFEAVIVSAMARTDAHVMAGYGEKYRFYVTPLGATINALALSMPLIVLWCGALFAALRRQRLKTMVPNALMSAAGLWLIAGMVEVVVGRALCTYYLLSLVPPLLILTAVVLSHGLDIPESRKTLAWLGIAVIAMAAPLVIEREALFSMEGTLTDYAGTQAVAQKLRDLGLRPEDRILVLNRGYDIYLETGAEPPTRYIHSTHTMTVFHTPSKDALGENLAAKPRYIIVANPSLRALDESEALYERAFADIHRAYRPAGEIRGKLDSFTIYQRNSGS